MAEYRAQLVEYKGDVDTEVHKEATNYVLHQLVLCAQDEMTSQTNDGQPESWASML